MKKLPNWLDVEQAAFILARKFPDLVRCKDYWVSHPVDKRTLEQTKTAWVPVWEPTAIPQPTPADLLAWWPEFEAEFALTKAPEDVRRQRGELLAQADRLIQRAMDDRKVALEAALRDYRGKLRAVPDQDGFPFDVQWPELPAE
ncbi:phage tail assembly chaperone [Burkholderia semiarida]|uniref:Phage tail assembly chaperone n=1 Tax=Burkholderia semiarida TaxID=2843303 RepID=A0ABW7LGY3_9BURK